MMRGAVAKVGAAVRVVAFVTAALVLQAAASLAQGGNAPSGPVAAVMPLANISGAAKDAWIGAGIAETVSADAASFVIADDAESARRHGVQWLVRGGYQRLGDRLRITARIVGIDDGVVASTVRVDGTVDELFDLQDRLVDELRTRLNGPGPPPAAPAPPPRVESGEGPPISEGVVETPAPRANPFARRAPTRPRESGAARRSPTVGPPGAEVDDGSAPSSAQSRFNDEARAFETTGSLVIGDAAVGVASNAGILTGRVSVQPPRTTVPPTVDGRLDDAAWRTAARITDFVQREPVDGAPASEATDVYVAYDGANLYLGFHAHYDDPGIMRANRSDRDRAGFSDDIISVYFDTFLDQQRAYVFSVNGYGVQGDSIVGGVGGGGGFGGRGGGGGRSGIPRGDRSWDALFESGGQLVEDGYTAEMAIPFKSLRYPSLDGDRPHTWGFQIVRRIRGKDETVVWSPVSRDIAGFLPQMGVLDGLTGLSTSRNLEIQPAFTAFRFGSLDDATGQVVDGDPQPELGANFKYGVTSNLTADFTLNPDFSQIESDRPQVEVNQRFALFFPELRPFFLEGAEIFSIQVPFTVVHTRTIVDPAFGAKLTGKAGNTTLGVLYANDEAPGAEINDPTASAIGETAKTFVGRVRYDLYSESFIGAVVTDREYLDGYSRLVGVDSNFRVGQTHQLGFRYMQSEHQDEDRLDTSGYVFDAGFRKRGRNLSYSIDASALSPDFRTDVGFVRRVDQRLVESRVGYQWWPQTWLISWGPEVRYGRNYAFNNRLQDENARVDFDFNFANNVRYSINFNRDMERFEETDFNKRRVSMFGNVNTSRRVSVGGGFNWGDEIYFDTANPFLGRERALRLFLNVRPGSRFQSGMNIITSRFTDPNGLFIPGVNDGSRRADGEIFNVNIFRALSSYQFTDRLLFRNITEFNTFDETIGLNFLFTYRVNSGTAFYIGYDDHYRQREQLDLQVNITERGYQQTNRAVFTKFQYLFRY